MFLVYAREVLGELLLNHLAKITLPKLFANLIGNVFVPNGNRGGMGRQRFEGGARQILSVSARRLVPGRGLYQIHRQSMTTQRGTQVWGLSGIVSRDLAAILIWIRFARRCGL